MCEPVATIYMDSIGTEMHIDTVLPVSTITCRDFSDDIEKELFIKIMWYLANHEYGDIKNAISSFETARGVK